MSTIKNYDSRATLSNYTIGTVYTFYLSRANLSRLVKISKDEAKKYSEAMIALAEAKKDLFDSNGQYMNFIRAIGVVVDKHEAAMPKNVNQITVMFQTESGDYVLNKYAVNTSNVLTNEKNYVLPAAVIDITAA